MFYLALSEQDFIHQSRLSTSLKLLYSVSDLPVDQEDLNCNSIRDAIEKKRAGRPRKSKRRIVSVAERITRNKYKCGLNVHNIRTCPRKT